MNTQMSYTRLKVKARNNFNCGNISDLTYYT